jgi:hypothetical protein
MKAPVGSASAATTLTLYLAAYPSPYVMEIEKRKGSAVDVKNKSAIIIHPVKPLAAKAVYSSCICRLLYNGFGFPMEAAWMYCWTLTLLIFCWW